MATMNTLSTTARPRPVPDRILRRVLRIPDRAPGAGSVAAAQSAFSRSMIVSGTRCLLTYVVLPFVAPAVGVATGIGPILGLLVGAAALATNVISMRRFWMAEHRWRWVYTVVALSVMVLVGVLMAHDLRELLT